MVQGLYLNKVVFKKHKGGLNNYLGLDLLFGDIIIYFSTQIKFIWKVRKLYFFFDNVIPVFQNYFKEWGFFYISPFLKIWKCYVIFKIMSTEDN